MMSYYFSIIGTRDNPLYELEFSSFKSPASAVPGEPHFAPRVRELLPFIANSSLDLVEDAQWLTSSFNLGRIDSFGGIWVNAFVTQGNVKFILCYDSPNSPASTLDTVIASTSSSKHDESSIKHFLLDAYDLYVKALLNPFYSANDPLVSPDFDYKLKSIARKYL